jgi:hypothetical protein
VSDFVRTTGRIALSAAAFVAGIAWMIGLAVAYIWWKDGTVDDGKWFLAFVGCLTFAARWADDAWRATTPKAED